MKRITQERHNVASERIANKIAGTIISKQLLVAAKINRWFQGLEAARRNFAIGFMCITICLMTILSISARWNQFTSRGLQREITRHIGASSGSIPNGGKINAIDTTTIIKH